MAGVEDTDCLHSLPPSSHSRGGRMESSISSVSSRISGAPVDGGADFVLGDLSSSLSMRTGLLYLTKEKVVPPPQFWI